MTEKPTQFASSTRNAPFSRQTSYNGVTMRSRLEAAWAEQFDALGWTWEYEPICLAGTSGQYLPDFKVMRPGAARAMWWEIRGGWWEADCSDDDYPALLEQHSVETDRMVSIVQGHDPTGTFVLAYQPAWTDQHVINAHTPMTLAPCGGPSWMKIGPRFSTVALCGCKEGCTNLVARNDMVCRDHGQDWQPISTVPSLYHDVFDGRMPRYQNSAFDALALILDWKA